jgi:hypothetical protein
VKTFISASLGLALLFGGGRTIQAQTPDSPPEGGRLGGFGTLETASEAGLKAKAAAWLKEAGKDDAATLQRFNDLWSQKERTLTDRLGETFALANADAAKLLANARNLNEVPAVVVPELLKKPGAESKSDAFFRANLGLAYVRILTNRRAYDEGCEVLKHFDAEQTAEPSAYLFHRAVCEHALLLKTETTRTIARLLTDAVDSPERYRTVSVLMINDMETWKEKDLGAVARKMKRIEERIELAKVGKTTQKLQKEVVLRLDELIKELENKAKKKEKDGPPKDGPPGSGPPGPPGDQPCPDGVDPGDGDGPPGNQVKKPMKDSNLQHGKGTGDVDEAKLKKLFESWGSLLPREREQAMAKLTEGMSPSHRQAIENYYRNISGIDPERQEAPIRDLTPKRGN